jgi:hypothetical protein
MTADHCQHRRRDALLDQPRQCGHEGVRPLARLDPADGQQHRTAGRADAGAQPCHQLGWGLTVSVEVHTVRDDGRADAVILEQDAFPDLGHHQDPVRFEDGLPLAVHQGLAVEVVDVVDGAHDLAGDPGVPHTRGRTGRDAVLCVQDGVRGRDVRQGDLERIDVRRDLLLESPRDVGSGHDMSRGIDRPEESLLRVAEADDQASRR